MKYQHDEKTWLIYSIANLNSQKRDIEITIAEQKTKLETLRQIKDGLEERLKYVEERESEAQGVREQ